MRCQGIKRWLTLTMLRATGPRSFPRLNLWIYYFRWRLSLLKMRLHFFNSAVIGNSKLDYCCWICSVLLYSSQYRLKNQFKIVFLSPILLTILSAVHCFNLLDSKYADYLFISEKKIILGDGGNSVQLKVPEHLCNNTWTTYRATAWFRLLSSLEEEFHRYSSPWILK